MSRRIEKSVSAGRSTSPQVTVAAAAGGVAKPHATLDKRVFIDRVARRTAVRYSENFTASQLEDLVEEGLVDEALRFDNDGQKPIYQYDFTSYRRALQITRFRQLGIVNRNDIRLMLFVRGYGFPARKVGEVLLRSHIANSRKLTAQVRSGYVDNTRAIPEKHRASLLAQMGPLDEALDAGGLRFHPDTIIDLLRVAKQGAIGEVAPPEVNRSFFRKIFDPKSSLVTFGRKVFSGLLNIGDGDDIGTFSKANMVSGVILNASDADMRNARSFHRLQVSLWLRLSRRSAWLGLPGLNASAALRKVAISIRDHPKWAALILVIGLRVLHLDKKSGNMLSRYREMRKFTRSK